MASDAGAEWFGPRQIYWTERLDREAANLRNALRFSLTDSPETALEITGTACEQSSDFLLTRCQRARAADVHLSRSR